MLRATIASCLAAMAMLFGITTTVFAEEITLVAFGDSTTARRDGDHVVVYASILEKAFSDKGIPLKVVNAGIGGNNTNQGRARFEKDVITQHPSWVIIQFGLNDAAVDVHLNPPATEPRVSEKRYEENLRYFVQTLKANNAKSVLMTPNPGRWTEATRKLYGKPPYQPEDPDGYNVLVRRYAEIVRHIAEQEKVPLIDVYGVFQTYNKQPGQSMDQLMLADGIHPNTQGHEIIAKLLLETIPIAEGQKKP
jgi:lysophospholipase L1-like esterase